MNYWLFSINHRKTGWKMKVKTRICHLHFILWRIRQNIVVQHLITWVSPCSGGWRVPQGGSKVHTHRKIRVFESSLIISVSWQRHCSWCVWVCWQQWRSCGVRLTNQRHWGKYSQNNSIQYTHQREIELWCSFLAQNGLWRETTYGSK